ncbi:hypothetical protein ACFQY7_18845 [Actinomadura luteofluorescens]|uniref:hypothetical protein n=1 Tax=Actinomadura luteofluorescens TaxID=46163 RepID=UPI00362D6AA9
MTVETLGGSPPVDHPAPGAAAAPGQPPEPSLADPCTERVPAGDLLRGGDAPARRPSWTSS